VIFAWDAISSVPLTSDKNIFLSVLNNVDYKNLTIQGSDFVKAFELANNRALISEDKSKAIIFISDWWDGDYNIDEKVLQSMRNEDIEYFMAWVGTKEWWRIITWRDVFWSISYQIYNWEYVISKLNENNLKKLAWIFDWKYLKLDKYNDINNFSSEIEKIEKKVIENNTYSNDVDASRMLAFISFLFFILYLILYLNSWKLTVNGKWFIW
jgi:Ca-activated chloride channel family protein